MGDMGRLSLGDKSSASPKAKGNQASTSKGNQASTSGKNKGKSVPTLLSKKPQKKTAVAQKPIEKKTKAKKSPVIPYLIPLYRPTDPRRKEQQETFRNDFVMNFKALSKRFLSSVNKKHITNRIDRERYSEIQGLAFDEDRLVKLSYKSRGLLSTLVQFMNLNMSKGHTSKKSKRSNVESVELLENTQETFEDMQMSVLSYIDMLSDPEEQSYTLAVSSLNNYLGMIDTEINSQSAGDMGDELRVLRTRIETALARPRRQRANCNKQDCDNAVESDSDKEYAEFSDDDDEVDDDGAYEPYFDPY